MLGAANSRLALTPIAKPGAAAANNATRMQPKDLSAPPAMAADELQEYAA
jgi:hypothetical protein